MNTDRIFSQSEAEEFKTVLKNLIDKNVPSYLQSRVNNFLEHFSEAYEYRLYFRKIRNIDLDSNVENKNRVNFWGTMYVDIFVMFDERKEKYHKSYNSCSELFYNRNN